MSIIIVNVERILDQEGECCLLFVFEINIKNTIIKVKI